MKHLKKSRVAAKYVAIVDAAPRELGFIPVVALLRPIPRIVRVK